VQEDRASTHHALLDVLDSDRYPQLLSSLDEAAAAPRVRDADVALEDLARDEFRKLRKRHRRLAPSPSAGELHKFRRRGERARYAAELAEAATGGRATRFIARAKELQDLLGEHEDALIAEDALRRLARRTRDQRTGPHRRSDHRTAAAPLPQGAEGVPGGLEMASAGREGCLGEVKPVSSSRNRRATGVLPL
jgi:CHAD domain-containing protein